LGVLEVVTGLLGEVAARLEAHLDVGQHEPDVLVFDL
jgi:hypothetical protein